MLFYQCFFFSLSFSTCLIASHHLFSYSTLSLPPPRLLLPPPSSLNPTPFTRSHYPLHPLPFSAFTFITTSFTLSSHFPSFTPSFSLPSLHPFLLFPLRALSLSLVIPSPLPFHPSLHPYPFIPRPRTPIHFPFLVAFKVKGRSSYRRAGEAMGSARRGRPTAGEPRILLWLRQEE